MTQLLFKSLCVLVDLFLTSFLSLILVERLSSVVTFPMILFFDLEVTFNSFIDSKIPIKVKNFRQFPSFLTSYLVMKSH